MTEVAADNRANAVIENVRATLDGLVVDGVRPFDSAVTIVREMSAFLRVDDPFKHPIAGAGIVEGTIDELEGTDDTEGEGTVRLPFSVVVRFRKIRVPGGGEVDATVELKRYANAVRDALRADPSRGGVCQLVQSGGRLVAGTDVSGSAKPVGSVPNPMFFAVEIPCVCAWVK